MERRLPTKLAGVTLNCNAERGGGTGGTVVDGVRHCVGEGLAVVQGVHRRVGVVEGVGEGPVGGDVELTELAVDVGADVAGDAVDRGDRHGSCGVGIVGCDVACDGVGRGIFGDRGRVIDSV